ncbi:MAG: hypothetical protein R3257_02345 [bacterium]|nr:hypothetical protein [bacterium]
MKKIFNPSLTLFVSFSLMAMMALTGCGKGCAKKGPKLSTEQKEVLKLIPSGKNILIGLNWEKMQDSPLGEKFKEKIPAEVSTFLKDIQGMTLGFTVRGMGQQPDDVVGVITGNLNADKLLSELKAQAEKEGQEVVSEDYQGIQVYTATKDPTMGIAFVAEKLVVGKKTAVKKVIDLSKGQGDSVEKDTHLIELLGAVDTRKMLWAVAIVPEGAIPAGGAGGPGNPMGALAGIKAIDLAMDMSKDLTVDLGVIAGTPEDAKQMETMANSYKTLFGTSLAQKDPNMGKVLNNLTIGVEGNRVALGLQVDQATVEELSKKAGGPQSPGEPEGMEAPAVPPPPPAPSGEEAQGPSSS